MTTKKRIRTVSGITNSIMRRILRYEFRENFYDCKIARNGEFIAFMAKETPLSKMQEFKNYWSNNENVTVEFKTFVPVED